MIKCVNIPDKSGVNTFWSYMLIPKGLMYTLYMHVHSLYIQSQHGFGTVRTICKFVYQERCTLTRVWWRCTVIDSGELCVMILLVQLMLTLYADNWDTLELHNMTD